MVRQVRNGSATLCKKSANGWNARDHRYRNQAKSRMAPSFKLDRGARGHSRKIVRRDYGTRPGIDRAGIWGADIGRLSREIEKFPLYET